MTENWVRRMFFQTGGRRQGKSEATRDDAEQALSEGKQVIVLGKDGRPIVPLDWWKSKPS